MDRANSTVRLSLAAARAHHEGGRGREVRLGIMQKHPPAPPPNGSGAAKLESAAAAERTSAGTLTYQLAAKGLSKESL